MTSPRIFLATIWRMGEKPVTTQVVAHQDGGLRYDSSILADGRAHLFFSVSDSRQYSLGEWNLQAGIARRPVLSAELLATSEDRQSVEPSALKRLSNILQFEPNVKLEVVTDGVSRVASLVPLDRDTIGAFFICELASAETLAGTAHLCILSIQGFAYSFYAHLVEQVGAQVAFALPSKAYRLLARKHARNSLDRCVEIVEPFREVATLENYSYSGLRLRTTEGVGVSIWSELKLILRHGIRDEVVETHALVVGAGNGRLHLLLSSGENDHKRRFYAIDSWSSGPLSLSQDPSSSWQVLRDYGYLALLSGQILDSVHSSCLAVWDNESDSNDHFQPVCSFDGEPVGTIAATRVEDDHWVPHSFAAKVDASLIPASSAIYLSWPNYIMTLGSPLWISTWYDANKTWHNRFYQVFILENQSSPELFSFVRRMFLTDRFVSMPHEMVVSVPFHELEEARKAIVEKTWGDRYGIGTSHPTARMEAPVSHHPFERGVLTFWSESELIGVAPYLASVFDHNPMSMLNICHLNMFSGKDSFHEVVALVREFYKSKGRERFCLSIDFDMLNHELEDQGFTSIGESRCLSTSSRLLPALISNNSLSFTDMNLRHGKR